MERRKSIENIVYAVQDGASTFANKFAGQAKEDYESIKKLVTIGGSKLGDILSDLQVSIHLFIESLWLNSNKFAFKVTFSLSKLASKPSTFPTL
jgi:hypothetical protein